MATRELVFKIVDEKIISGLAFVMAEPRLTKAVKDHASELTLDNHAYRLHRITTQGDTERICYRIAG